MEKNVSSGLILNKKIPQGGWGEGFEAYARLRGVMFELSRFYYTKQVHLFIFLNEKLKKR